MSARMKIIIATDIFGYGKHLDELSSSLSDICGSITVVSPYTGQPPTFSDENEAYEKFSLECGHEKFSLLIEKEISSNSDNVLLIGFSAGASAIWKAIGTSNHSNIISFIGFYPSQIRNHLGLSPSCPTTIVFPCSENSFNVAEAAKVLSQKSKVKCQVTAFEHGFMNPCSNNYSAVGEKTFNKLIKDRLRLDAVNRVLY